MSDSEFVYTLRRVAPVKVEQDIELPPGEAVTFQPNTHGNFLFGVEPEKVPVDKFQEGLDKCLAVARTILTKSTDVIKEYRVETVTLKLGLDGKVGIAFVGDAEVEASIEIEIKRIDSTGA